MNFTKGRKVALRRTIHSHSGDEPDLDGKSFFVKKWMTFLSGKARFKKQLLCLLSQPLSSTVFGRCLRSVADFVYIFQDWAVS